MFCEQCGKEFDPKWKGNKFCSLDCSQEYMRQTRTTRQIQNCIVCGKPFLGETHRKSKYCSMDCRNADWHNAHAEHLSSTNKKPRTHSAAFITKQKARAQCKAQAKEYKQKQKLIKKLCKSLQKREAQLKMRVCEECGKEFRPTRNTQVCCSKACSNRRSNRQKDKRIYQNGQPDLSISLTRLYMRDMGVCALCGRHIDFDNDSNGAHYPSVDHIIPLSKGGEHSWDNVQLACRECNTKKSDKM